MTIHDPAGRILDDADLRALIRRRNRVCFALTAAILAIYYGFVALVAWGRGAIGLKLGGGFTAGIPIGIGVIAAAALLTWIYVRWANSRYDGEVARLRRRFEDGNRG